MALVGHGRRPEQALQALKVQLVRSKLVEDDGDVLEVLPPRRTIDENVIKETNTNLRKYGRMMSFIRAWNVVGELESPNGMTRNSYWLW
jgi:hypothetical protein